jgi:glycosidase
MAFFLIVFVLTEVNKQKTNGLNCSLYSGCLHLQVLFQGPRKYVIFIEGQKIISFLLFLWNMRILLFVMLTFCWACKEDQPQPEDPTIIIDPGTSGYQQYGTPIDSVPYGRDIQMYEVNLRAFSTTSDLSNVTAQLDRLDSLGINVVWLMPIHPIGAINSVNSPYSVKDYKAVSPEYGTLQDLRDLTDAAHAKGMAVIMDWVANHTAWDNPWMEHKSWYTQDVNGNVISPAGTNWADVADLNFDNDSMRSAMIDAMKYWVLEANVDGFRCDYADGVPFDFWQQAIADLRSIPNRSILMLAEGERTDHYAAGFDLTYGWSFYSAMLNMYNGSPASQLNSAHLAEYTAIPVGKHKLRFTSNHDECAWVDSPIGLFNGFAGAMTASAVNMMMGGAQLLYTGQEIGYANPIPFFSNSNINWNLNPSIFQFYKRLGQFYASSLAAKKGFFTHYSTAELVCFKRQWNDEEVFIVANPTSNSINFTIPAALQSTSWTDVLNGGMVTLNSSVSMSPYGLMLLHH